MSIALCYTQVLRYDVHRTSYEYYVHMLMHGKMSALSLSLSLSYTLVSYIYIGRETLQYNIIYIVQVQYIYMLHRLQYTLKSFSYWIVLYT